MRFAVVLLLPPCITALRLSKASFDDNVDENVDNGVLPELSKASFDESVVPEFTIWREEMQTPQKVKQHRGTCPTDEMIESQNGIPEEEHYQGTECFMSDAQQSTFMKHLLTNNYCHEGKASQKLYLENHGTCPSSLWKRGKHLTKNLAPVLGGLNNLVTGKTIVFTGDSLIRGLMVSTVGAFRTAEHQIDYSSKQHARYITTRTEDEMQLLIKDASMLHDPLPFKKDESLSVSFMWGDTFPGIETGMHKYFNKHTGVVDNYVMMPTCMWATGTTKEDTMKNLLSTYACSATKKTGCARVLTVLACPLEHLHSKGANWYTNAAKANKEVEQWVTDLSEEHPNIYFTDFNKHIQETPGGSVACASGNWHYVCTPQPKIELWTGDSTKFDLLPKEDGTCLFRQGNPYVGILKEILPRTPLW